MPGHQPSQLGRATTNKATQAPPLRVGSDTTAVEQIKREEFKDWAHPSAHPEVVEVGSRQS